MALEQDIANLIQSTDALTAVVDNKAQQLDNQMAAFDTRIAKKEQGYYWCHDQRLTLRSLLSMTDTQLAPFMEAVSSPVLVIGSTQAVIHKEIISERIAMLKNVRMEILPGGHHQHLDGDVSHIAGLLSDFLGQS